MITLHVFGPAFGLPDPSMFVIKADVLLKLSGLPYEKKPADVRKAPKRKLPVIVDNGVPVPDSTFIRFHLEDKHGIDFDAGLTPAEKGSAWAFDKMLEDQLYWVTVRERWMDPVNFDRGPRNFFKPVPAPLRPLVIAMINRDVRRTLWGQGLGRHSDADMLRLAKRAVDSLSAMLGDKPFLMGRKACAVDATLFGWVASALCPLFRSAVRDHIETLPNLVAYRDRGMQLWYPEFANPAAAKAASGA